MQATLCLFTATTITDALKAHLPQCQRVLVCGGGVHNGVLMAKLMNLLSRQKINPLIGAAGVSAVPMAARVVSKVGLEANPHNFLLMHAMGPNVAGVIGSAVASGILIHFAS